MGERAPGVPLPMVDGGSYVRKQRRYASSPYAARFFTSPGQAGNMMYEVSGLDGSFEHTGRRIKRLRRMRRITQEDLGELTGLHASYIGQIERGQRTPSVKTLDAIARALQVDPALLVKSTDADDADSPVEDLLTLVAGASPEQVRLITRIAETVLSSGYRVEIRRRGSNAESPSDAGGR